MTRTGVWGAAFVVAALTSGPAMAQMVTPGVGVGIPNGMSGPGGTVQFTPAPNVGADMPTVGRVGGRARYRTRGYGIVRRGPGLLSDQRR